MKMLLAIIVMLNGKPIEFKDAKPFMQGTSVMAPARGIFEKAGVRVEYFKSSRTIEFQRGAKTIVLYVGSQKARINGVAIDVYFGATQKDGRVFIPLRFVAKYLGAKVRYEKAQRTFFIDMENEDKDSSPSSIKADEIEVRTTSDNSTYHADESITLTVTATNKSDRTLNMNFRSGYNFDVTITPKGKDNPRWDWSRDRTFDEALRARTLKPGGTLTFKDTWPQWDNEGKFRVLPRGEYTVQARLMTEKPIAAPPITITLAP